MHVIDRRPNPRGKSLSNRQRFLRRARALVRQAVRDASAQRRIKDVEKGGDVVIPGGGVREPVFRRDHREGVRDHVLPGNREYVAGDEIRKPRGGQGGGGSEASDDGDGEDAFRFALTEQEFLDLFLEDLELPDLAKRKLATMENPAWRRAGFMAYGSPANLSVSRTLRNSHVAPHRAQAPQARRDRGADRRAGGGQGGGRRGGDRAAGAGAGDGVQAAEPDPLYRPDRRPLPTLRADAQADHPGGDVLPDGRLRLDDRAHEGPRQAVLHAALHLPEAALPARGRGVHPPHPPGRGGGRGHLLPQPARPAARWCRRRWRRCCGWWRRAIVPRTGTSTPPRPRTATTWAPTTTRPRPC